MRGFLEKLLLVALLLFIGLGGGRLMADSHTGPSDSLRTAMTMYEEGRYGEAVEALIKAEADPIAIGNAYYYTGLQTEDPMNRISFYQSAIDAYEIGIVEEPQRVDLKYNYEFVKDLLEEQEEEDQSSEDQENSEEGEASDQEGDSEGDDQSQDSQDQGSEDQESSEENGEEGDNQEDVDQPSDEGQDSGEGNQEEDSQENQGSGQEQEGTPTDQELQQILQLLESQEAESLKNNQEVIQGDQGDGNDW